jgi:hypothetical protein
VRYGERSGSTKHTSNGIVSKSTTAGISMSLLRKVPGVNFGPDVVTWPALVSAFAEKAETFEHKGEFHVMSALTLESSEFGNLLNPQDKEMVDLLVNLWDGKPGTFEKKTKHSGNDSVENPWINLIACTTPSWIAGNFPEYMIGGGFTSRCIFVYADKKAKHVAYPGLAVPADLEARAEGLRLDLEHISTLAGEYVLIIASGARILTTIALAGMLRGSRRIFTSSQWCLQPPLPTSFASQTNTLPLQTKWLPTSNLTCSSSFPRSGSRKLHYTPSA